MSSLHVSEPQPEKCDTIGRNTVDEAKAIAIATAAHAEYKASKRTRDAAQEKLLRTDFDCKVVPVALLSPDSGGHTVVLGYLSLPSPAHTVCFAEVRKLIVDSVATKESGAFIFASGMELEKDKARLSSGIVPSDFVFMRSGAPVGRKQEQRFTISSSTSEPGMIVLRSRNNTAAERNCAIGSTPI